MNKHKLKRLERALKPPQPGQVFVIEDDMTEEERQRIDAEYEQLSDEAKRNSLFIHVHYGRPEDFEDGGPEED